MKKLKLTSYIVALVCFLAFLLSNFSVHGAWLYYRAAPEQLNLNIDISLFQWKGSEGLPNNQAGQDHHKLIGNILNGTTTENGQTVGVGLNTEGSYLGEQISERKSIWWRDADMLGSMDIWEDDTINNYFNLNEATSEVSFVLYFPDGSDDFYYLYTTSVPLGARRKPNIAIGQTIYPIYRTTLKLNENGRWEAILTEIGSAPSAYYQNPILGVAVDPGFDIDNWVAGYIGSQKGTAINAFVGQDVSVDFGSYGEMWYKITTTSRIYITLTTETENTTIYAYDSNEKLLSLVSGSQGSQSLRFRSGNNTNTYYIKVVGSSSAVFSITQA